MVVDHGSTTESTRPGKVDEPLAAMETPPRRGVSRATRWRVTERGCLCAAVVGFVGLLVISVCQTAGAMLTIESAFVVVKKSVQFENELWEDSAKFNLAAYTAGFSGAEVWYEYAEAALEGERETWAELARGFRRQRRRSRKLSEARASFRRVEHKYEALVALQEATLLALPSFRQNATFDEYAQAFMESAREAPTAVRRALADELTKFVERLKTISTRAGTVTFVVLICAQAALCAVIAVLACSVRRIFESAGERLEARDRLARQQAHEMRNKYAPAMYSMELFVETARRDDATVDDFKAQHDDVCLALVALREVEQQHQSRMDMYKIMRGNYVAHRETFGVLAFLRERVRVERAIALARNGGAASGVDYEIRVADPDLGDCDEIHVRADFYILNHVVSNCLSNSRKFTFSGSVVVTFCGATDDGLLVFDVADTGTGLPPHVVDTLFCQEAATGDHRGTGLGLPSCALFCKTAGGYIKLKGTRQQDDAGRNGFTRFEFAIAGRVVRADRPAFSVPPPEPDDVVQQVTPATPDGGAMPPKSCCIPDDVSVVVVDDSPLNRTCVLRSLRKVELEVKAKGWTYAQFETIEAAQPFLIELHEASKRAIVCLDEQMGSRGGVMTGIQGTRWLLHDLGFRGIIVSTSGDPAAGQQHIALGAHANWGLSSPCAALVPHLAIPRRQAAAPARHHPDRHHCGLPRSNVVARTLRHLCFLTATSTPQASPTSPRSSSSLRRGRSRRTER
mmetsp:Transcript_1478/g.4421  ORF Transcript_1478/g.4421 Transcript_1478/m.4421 type:complete len:740 (-) Transcript_1478:308-2527(-)